MLLKRLVESAGAMPTFSRCDRNSELNYCGFDVETDQTNDNFLFNAHDGGIVFRMCQHIGKGDARDQ